MAQTGFTPVVLYNSGTTTNVPLASNLANGELAINYTDGKLFYKDNSGTVQTIATKNNVQISLPTSISTGGLIVGNGSNTTTALGIGTSGYVLTSNGTTASWAAPTGSVAPIVYNLTTVSSNLTVSSGQNGFSVGPVTINSGNSVTVTSGQRWVVI
jgi:hypothetical protein